MKILTHGAPGVGRTYSQLTMFAPHPDGSFTVGLSEWADGGFPDPITGRTVYGWKRHLTELQDNEENETISWSGILPSGAKVTVFND